LEEELPESRSQINHDTDVANALPNILHGVFISVGVGIEGPEIFHQSDAPIPFGDGKDENLT
jgi:hypothetical protein